MDLSQKEIIIKSLRIEKPSKLKGYKSLFPVNKDKKEFLNVASLDDSVESLLIKKYGQKGAFGNSPKTLYQISQSNWEVRLPWTSGI